MTATSATFLHFGIGNFVYDLGLYAEALRALEPALAWRRENLGEHVNTAMTINFIGMANLMLGQIDKAQTYFEEVRVCVWQYKIVLPLFSYS